MILNTAMPGSGGGKYLKGTSPRKSGHIVDIPLPFKPRFVLCANGDMYTASSGTPAACMAWYWVDGNGSEHNVTIKEGGKTAYTCGGTTGRGWEALSPGILSIRLDNVSSAYQTVFWEAIG